MFIDPKEVGGPNEFDRISDEELEAFIRGDIEPGSGIASHPKQKH
jgi:hypothetical protein